MHGRSDHLYEDTMLAVTAFANELVLVTRNGLTLDRCLTGQGALWN